MEPQTHWQSLPEALALFYCDLLDHRQQAKILQGFSSLAAFLNASEESLEQLAISDSRRDRIHASLKSEETRKKIEAPIFTTGFLHRTLEGFIDQ